jgi:hypothetical protein
MSGLIIFFFILEIILSFGLNLGASGLGFSAIAGSISTFLASYFAD